MMKESNAPRKVYSRNGITHVCYAGGFFAPKDSEKTGIDLRFPVKCEAIEDDETRLKVTQRRGNKKPVTETWGSVKVPRKARKAA